MWNLKNGTNKLIYKTEIESQIQKTNMITMGGRGGRRDKLGDWDWHIHATIYIKQVTNKDLLYSTGNSTQYSVMTYKRKESKKEWNIYVCITY